MYCVNELQCEGSELSFEELRARRYFAKRIQQEEQRQLGEKTFLRYTRIDQTAWRNFTASVSQQWFCSAVNGCRQNESPNG